MRNQQQVDPCGLSIEALRKCQKCRDVLKVRHLDHDFRLGATNAQICGDGLQTRAIPADEAKENRR